MANGPRLLPRCTRLPAQTTGVHRSEGTPLSIVLHELKALTRQPTLRSLWM
jgi:hypothetical protein